MKKTIWILVAICILAGGAYFIFGRPTAPSQPIVGGDKDIHGCIGSAGYSWCELKQKCLRTWEEKCEAGATASSGNPNSADTASASVIIVKIKSFAFVPAIFTVKKGDTVKWINEDNVPHTVTSDSGNLLNSPTLQNGQSFSFTFTDSASLSYHCAIHPSMKGKVVVE